MNQAYKLSKRQALFLLLVLTFLIVGIAVGGAVTLKSAPAGKRHLADLALFLVINYAVILNIVYFLAQDHSRRSLALLPLVFFVVLFPAALLGHSVLVGAMLIGLSILCVSNAIAFTRNRAIGRSSGTRSEHR